MNVFVVYARKNWVVADMQREEFRLVYLRCYSMWTCCNNLTLIFKNKKKKISGRETFS